LRNTLREIEQLERSHAEGNNLRPNQLVKIGKKAHYLQVLWQVEREAAPSASALQSSASESEMDFDFDDAW